MNEFLKTLTETNGPSGSETPVRSLLEEKLNGRFQYTVDRIGNLYAHSGGFQPSDVKLMITAHMDEVGLIVRHITDDGFLRFKTIGGIDERILPGKAVVVGRNKVKGVIGSLAIHLQTKEEREQITKIRDLYIDIGAKDKAQAEEYVKVGDTVSFVSSSDDVGKLMKAKALDDRVGCVTLLRLLETMPDGNFTAVFTTREEVGCFGAKAAAGIVKPNYAIVLEGTTASDTGETPEADRVCVVGNGPVLSFMDRTAIYDRKFLELAKSVAERENIPYQLKKAVTGGNEAGCIQHSGTGCHVLTISLPCRYIHGPTSMASEEDMKNMLRLAKAIIQQIK